MKILYSLCCVSWWRIFNSRDPKWKRKVMLGGLLALIFIAYLYGYCFFAAMTLASIGLIDMLPPSIFTIASLICLMTSIYHVDGALLHAHDDVILGALPLSRKTIVLSKIIPIYISNLLIYLTVFLFGILAMVQIAPISFSFIWRLILLLPWAPLLPLAFGLVIGLIIAYISRRFVYSKQMSIVLTFAFIILLYVYIFNMQNVDDPSSLFAMLSTLLTNIYPLSSPFLHFLMDADWLSYSLYVFVQALSFFFLVWAFSHYKEPHAKTVQKRHKKVQSMKSRRPLWALYRKEMRRYINSVPYVTNTAITYVLLIGACIYLQFQDLDQLLILLEIPELKEGITFVIPLVIGMMIGIGTTTSCAIAIEGKGLWQLKCLPIKVQTIFLAKIMVNLSLAIPSTLIIVVLLTNALHLDLLTAALTLIIPTLYAVFFSQIGLVGNLFFPHLNWTSEVKAVKQGTATMFVVITAMALGFIPIALMQFNISPNLILSGVIMVLVIGNIACACYLAKPGVKRFQQLS